MFIHVRITSKQNLVHKFAAKADLYPHVIYAIKNTDLRTEDGTVEILTRIKTFS